MKEITTANFDDTVKDGVTVIDWWAAWCGPCRAFSPIFERVANKHKDITFAKVNVDEHPDLASRFGIHSIPSVMILKDGEVLVNQPGMVPESTLDKAISSLASDVS